MTSIFIASPPLTLCYRLLCSVKYKGGDVKGIVGKARIAPPNTGNSAAPRRLPPRQGDPCKRSAHSGTVVVHVPLPRVRRAIIHEGRVEAVGRGVVEQEGNGIASYGAAADALGIEGCRGSVIEPHAGIHAGLGIATKQHHRFIGRAIQRWHARYFVHLQVLAAQQPLEGHIVDGLLASDGAAQHPTPNKAWEERVRMQCLAEQTCRGAQESESEYHDHAHCHSSRTLGSRL